MGGQGGWEGFQMKCLELDRKDKLGLDRKGGGASGEAAVWRKVWLSKWSGSQEQWAWGREKGSWDTGGGFEAGWPHALF